MPPVTFTGSLCKFHVVLCSKIAEDVHGIEVHDIRIWKFVYFRKLFRFLLHNTRGVTRGHNSQCAESLLGAKKSQHCHKHFFQNSTFASERPQVRTWGYQTCFFTQAPSNLVKPLRIRIVWPKWRNLFTKTPAHQWQTINHKLFNTKCCWLSKSFDHRK